MCQWSHVKNINTSLTHHYHMLKTSTVKTFILQTMLPFRCVNFYCLCGQINVCRSTIYSMKCQVGS